jgi:hypothetical protein
MVAMSGSLASQPRNHTRQLSHPQPCDGRSRTSQQDEHLTTLVLSSPGSQSALQSFALRERPPWIDPVARTICILTSMTAHLQLPVVVPHPHRLVKHRLCDRYKLLMCKLQGHPRCHNCVNMHNGGVELLHLIVALSP